MWAFFSIHEIDRQPDAGLLYQGGIHGACAD